MFNHRVVGRSAKFILYEIANNYMNLTRYSTKYSQKYYIATFLNETKKIKPEKGGQKLRR